MRPIHTKYLMRPTMKHPDALGAWGFLPLLERVPMSTFGERATKVTNRVRQGTTTAG